MSAIELKNKTVKCRKPHRCTWCGEGLSIGDEAIYRAGVYQGDFFSEHYHPECYEAMYISDYGCDDEFTPMEQLRGKTYQESHQ